MLANTSKEFAMKLESNELQGKVLRESREVVKDKLMCLLYNIQFIFQA